MWSLTGLNRRLPDYESGALTNWAKGPLFQHSNAKKHGKVSTFLSIIQHPHPLFSPTPNYSILSKIVFWFSGKIQGGKGGRNKKHKKQPFSDASASHLSLVLWHVWFQAVAWISHTTSPTSPSYEVGGIAKRLFFMFLFLVLFTIRQYCIISPQKFSTEPFYVFAFGGKGSYLG